LVVFAGKCREVKDFRAVAALGVGRAMVWLRAESSDVPSAGSVAATEITV
jgi:hypothetical protein